MHGRLASRQTKGCFVFHLSIYGNQDGALDSHLIDSNVWRLGVFNDRGVERDGSG